MVIIIHLVNNYPAVMKPEVYHHCVHKIRVLYSNLNQLSTVSKFMMHSPPCKCSSSHFSSTKYNPAYITLRADFIPVAVM
jgi:hypothetical protein